MSLYKMSNYKSTIKSSRTSSSTSSSASRTWTRATTISSKPLELFILINLLVLVQCFLCTATATQQQKPYDNITSVTAVSNTHTLSSLAANVENSANATNNDTVQRDASVATSDAVESNSNSNASDGHSFGVYDAASAGDNDLKTINQLFTQLTNATLFNEASSNEYDATTVLLLGNVTYACLQTCMEEVSVN